MRLLPLLASLLLIVPATRAAEPVFEIRAVAERPGPLTQEYQQAATKGEKPEKLYLESETLLGIADIYSAEAVRDNTAGWVVRVRLTGSGSDHFAEITERYFGKRIAFLINGKVRCSPCVRGIIRSSVDINDDFTADEAAALATGLNRAAASPGTP